VVPGALVEGADQLPGRSQHDRIETTAAVGLPAVEDGVEGGAGVADVDASPVQVEAECFGSAVADGESGGGLCRVGEPVQLGQPERAVAGLDVAEHPAGTDRGQLLIITDKPDAAAAADDELDGGGVGRVALLPYLVFYSAFDAVVGLSNGLVVKYGSELPPAEQAVLIGVSDVLANLVHHPAPLTLYLIGTLSWAVTVIAAAVALSQARARRTATIPLALAGVIAPPFGPV
jgi:hypothetical protein